jgi:hypothetical protein
VLGGLFPWGVLHRAFFIYQQYVGGQRGFQHSRKALWVAVDGLFFVKFQDFILYYKMKKKQNIINL